MNSRIVLSVLKQHLFLLIICLVSISIYSFYINYEMLYQNNDAANALKLSSFLLQAGMLFFIMYGYLLGRNMKSSSKLYAYSKNRTFISSFYYVAILLFTIIFVGILFIAPTFIYYFKIEPFNDFYSSSLSFYLSNLLLPYFLVGLVGYIVGQLSNSKFSFTYLVLLWALLSPTNHLFFGELLANTGLYEGFSVLESFNLGVKQYDELYHPFYGFEFEWVKKISLLLVLLTIYLFVAITKKSLIRRVVLTLLTITLFFISILPTTSTENNLSILKSDIPYYKESVDVPSDDWFDYNVSDYDIKINSFTDFNVDLNLIVSEVTSPKIALTLYRGFKIDHVKSSLEKKVDYERKGDFLIIEPSAENGESFELTIKYTGSGSYSNPATSEHIFLPSDFAWLPINIGAPTHGVFNNQLITNKITHNTKKHFKVSYKGEAPLDFINLKKVGKSVYEGQTSGVTLIKGDLTSYGDELYYPKSWFTYNKELKAYKKTFSEQLREYNNIFNTDYSLPERVVFLPSMDLNTSYSFVNVTYLEETLIVQVDPVKVLNSTPIPTQIPFQIDHAVDPVTFQDTQDITKMAIYSSIFGQNINNETDKFSNNFSKFLQKSAMVHLNKKKSSSVERLLLTREINLNNHELRLLKSSYDSSQRTFFEDLKSIIWRR